MPHTPAEKVWVLDVPLDDISLDDLVERIDRAVTENATLFISTINTNFLTASRRSRIFRKSLMESDVTTVDGLGVVLLARVLGRRLRGRVTGADLLERLCSRPVGALGRPLQIFLLGGAEGAAEGAKRAIERSGSPAIACAGALDPGHGDVEHLSRPEVIDAINTAQPDFLIVSFGAEKGQAWLLRNRESLDVPVYSHLGAAVNFLAGTIRRAPPGWQRLGLEWLWRIGAEPRLATRYARDAAAFAALLRAAVMLAVADGVDRFGERLWGAAPLAAVSERTSGATILRLTGRWRGGEHAWQRATAQARAARKPVVLNLRGLGGIGIRAIGDLQQLRLELERHGTTLSLTGATAAVRRRLSLSCVADKCLATEPIPRAAVRDATPLAPSPLAAEQRRIER